MPDTWEWPMDALVSAQRVKTFTADQSIPEQLRELQDKETQPTKQASWDGLNLRIQETYIQGVSKVRSDFCFA